MATKMWSLTEIRSIARQTVEGKVVVSTARGAYFRALVESTQSELDGETDQAKQIAAVKKVHRKFYPVVQEATTTDDIKLNKKASREERRRCALERNRRGNFARSAYGTIKRWLRASGHDLLKLDPDKVTKLQLLNEAPPTRKHALTHARIHAKAGRLIDQLVGYAKQIAKVDRVEGAAIVEEATQRLLKQVLAVGITPTTDAAIASSERRPLRVGKTVFLPAATDGARRAV